MIEIKSITHIQRLYAKKLFISDLFKAVYYAGYRGNPAKIPFYYKVTNGETAITDLSQPLDVILASMKSNTRNEIRRAEREGCYFDVGDDYDSFIPYYNSFCESKGLVDKVDMARMTKYNGDNHLIITKVIHGDHVLAMHATVVNKKEKIAFLVLSGSQRLDSGVDKKIIGWGNRFLHYKDFEYLQSLGIKEYDWSGTCSDPNDERYNISQFKLSFGGRQVPSVVLESPLFVLLSKIRPLIEKFR